MAFDPRRYAHFVKEDRCNCSSLQLCAIKFSKVECYANHKRVAEMGDLASPGGYWIPANYGVTTPTRCPGSAVQRQFISHEVHVTQERMGPRELRHEFGQYTNIYSSEELTGINATANVVDIDNVFSEMGETGHDYANSKTRQTAYENIDNLFSDMSD
uniref:C2H2-type domain-containing protein n=1 Tax=Globodera pallida TaxID=36090 RepID=A0A183BMH7_GLOPA